MGGKSGGSPDMQTVTQESKIMLPPWLEGAYQGVADDAFDLYSQGPQYVPFSDQTMTGLTTLEGLSMDPNQIPGYAQSFAAHQNLLGGGGTGAYSDFLNDTMGGAFLYGGDGFNAALDAAGRQILPQVKSAFNSAGRTGGGLAQAAMTEELGDVFAGMYQTERSRQQQAAEMLQREQQLQRQAQMGALGMSPSMYNLAMAPAQTMAGVGSVLEGKEREIMNAPEDALNTYISQLSGFGPLFAGESTTGQQPVYDSGGAGLLGTALSLGGMFLGGPAGGALGGLGAPALAGAGVPLSMGSTMGAFDMGGLLPFA